MRKAGRARAGRAFFAVGGEALAQALIGCRLVRVLDDGTRLSGRIVETEAYLGVQDRGSHAFGGRRSTRNSAMYARAGTAYVYFTYGMHFCMNVVGGQEGEPVAALVRALESVEGIEAMRALRRGASGKVVKDIDLCRGPGRLCQALAIDRALNHEDLVTSERLWVEVEGGETSESGAGVILRRSARIGLNSAGPKWTGRLLRYFEAGSPAVSVHRRGVRVPSRKTPGRRDSPD